MSCRLLVFSWLSLDFFISPLTDVDSFIALSWTFESVGTSAYTGAMSVLKESSNLLEAASILSTE